MKTIVIGSTGALFEALKGLEGLDVRSGKLTEDDAINAAVEAKVDGSRLIAISTAEVFSGRPPREPWAWGEMDIPRPETEEGAAALAGERIIQLLYPDNSVILRTYGLYDGSLEVPREAVTDARYNPTPIAVVVDVVKFLLEHPSVSGNVHATCEDQCSPYEFALEAKRLLGERAAYEVKPTTTADPTRPLHFALKKSVLNLLGYRTPNWKDALSAVIAAKF